ncbi:uncharacterized protein FYW47_012975 [Aplochiton taeniatus]
MAAAVSLPSSSARVLSFEDYGLYSNLSEDQLIQMVIERSLSDAHSSAPLAGIGGRPYSDLSRSFGDTVSHFIMGNGKRMVAYRRYDGTLQLAPEPADLSCVEVLLDRGANPDIVNKDRETALYKACERDNAELVAALLNHGALVNKPSLHGCTALHEAVCRNNVEICEMLVKAGAKIGAANIYGITPLFTAAQTGCVETLRFLIKLGADVNTQASDGATALYEAAKNGHEEIVELLLHEDADANRAGRTGLLPLHIAAQNGTDAKSLLTYECVNYDKSINIVSMLIPATSKSRVRRSGISPLHLASESSHDEVLEVLIAAGFDVNAQLSAERSQMYEDKRSTALLFAVNENNLEATAMLLNAGADPNLDPFSPLLIAVRQGCIKTVTLLVEHGANVNAYIPTHPTSFPAAILFGMKYPPMLQYLMDNGCDAQSCFSCMYGSNPHPPIKTTHSERDGTYRSENTSVQFCEMISNPLIFHWVGPIINILLDYVGEVQLCTRLTENLDTLPDWEFIREKAGS